MSKHPDDESFTDDELREMEAALHLVHAQSALAEGKEADDDGDGEKLTKQEAHYRPGTTHRFCEACSMFLFSHHDSKNGDGKCTLVEGNINPSALCDHYERKRERAADDQGEHDDGRVRYERVRGVPEPGSFRLPHHAVKALGQGDPRAAGRVIASLFGTSADDPLTIPPETVHRIGNGDIGAGHRVLHRFVQRLRSGRAQANAR